MTTIGPPSRKEFTNKEWVIVQKYRTTLQVQRFLTSMPYNWESNGGTLRSFREVVRHGTAHCLEAALAAAVIMEQHGYPPLIMSVESQDLLDHVLFVFQEKGKWGSIGRSRDLGLHGRKPVFRSLRDLTWSYFDPYVDLTGRIKGYGVTNLYSLGSYDWRFASFNMKKIERHLNEIPHTRIRSSDLRYAKLHQEYKSWKLRFPGRPKDDYRRSDQWMI